MYVEALRKKNSGKKNEPDSSDISIGLRLVSQAVTGVKTFLLLHNSLLEINFRGLIVLCKPIIKKMY
jgi:hypothetical protein